MTFSCDTLRKLKPVDVIQNMLWLSGPGESHPQALPKPDVNLSTHPAPTDQPWANGFAALNGSSQLMVDHIV